MQFILISRICNENVSEYNIRREKEWKALKTRYPGATEDSTTMSNGIMLVDVNGKDVGYMSLYGTRPTPPKMSRR
jgi:hypothetical protein